MAEVKVTRKDIFARIAERCADDPEIVELCEKQIAQLSKPRKPRENTEAIEFAAAVATELTSVDGPITNKEMAARMGVSPQKMSAAFRRLVAEGTVVRTDGEKAKDPATFMLA